MYVNNLSPKGLKAVTLSDTQEQQAVVGILCTAAGDVKLTDSLGNTTTLTLSAGDEINLQIRKLWATGTTATVLTYVEA